MLQSCNTSDEGEILAFSILSSTFSSERHPYYKVLFVPLQKLHQKHSTHHTAKMAEHWDIYANWNPWHGCTKISPGCKYCYVYRQDEMYGSEISSSDCRKTAQFNLPIKRKRDKTWKIESGKMVFTCFTSDFLLKDADTWRSECWQMMKERSDLWFYFFTD